MICRTNIGSDLEKVNSNIRTIRCPYTGELLSCVPAYQADTAIFHAQRADSLGNVQMHGIIGEHKEAAFGARHVIVTVEEIVDHAVIREEPNATVFPSVIVDAVVQVPRGAYPAYVQGRYERDNDFYIAWNEASKDPMFVERYIKEWIYDVKDHAEYLEKLEKHREKAGGLI